MQVEVHPQTMASPAYYPHQMPMVQNSYTKAVEDSDMPKPQFNGQLESYDEWVEKLLKWLGKGMIPYTERPTRQK